MHASVIVKSEKKSSGDEGSEISNTVISQVV